MPSTDREGWAQRISRETFSRLGDRTEGHADLLPQAQHHRLRDPLPALHVPCICHREERPARHPDPRPDRDHPALFGVLDRAGIDSHRAAGKDLRPAALGTDLAPFAGLRREPERFPLQPGDCVPPARDRYHSVQHTGRTCTGPRDCHGTHCVLLCHTRDAVRRISHRERGGSDVDAQHGPAAADLHLRCLYPAYRPCR